MSDDKAKKAEEFKKMNAGESNIQERTTDDGKKEYLDDVSGKWVGKSELKKIQKTRKTEEAAAKKAAEKTKKEEEKKASGVPEKKKKVEEEELDPTKYTENRKNFLANQRKEGKNPYPHKFNRDMTVP